ncbi:50S ribosomal protein L25 [Patescibacteria group bacterium]|nr:50S ribosomal protein L25 [Patescibacteria group bacterium]
MITLIAKIREKTESSPLLIPAVVYGNKIKNVSLFVNTEEFKKVFSETGESSLVSLQIEGEKEPRAVLIHEIQQDYVTGKFTHIDFFQASLTEEVEVEVPLVFEGISLAIKDLGGTLVREIHEIEVKALAQDLPHDIKVDISGLNTFDDEITVKDLNLPKGVRALKGPNEIVAKVVAPSKIEEELKTPIEEDVESVEKIEKEKKEEEVVPSAE